MAKRVHLRVAGGRARRARAGHHARARLLWWVHFADDTSLARVEEVVEDPRGVSGRTALIAFSLGYLVLMVSLWPVVRDQHSRTAIGEASTTSG